MSTSKQFVEYWTDGLQAKKYSHWWKNIARLAFAKEFLSQLIDYCYTVFDQTKQKKNLEKISSIVIFGEKKTAEHTK